MVNLAALTSLKTCLTTVCSGRSDCVAFSSDFDLLYDSSWVKPYNLAVDVTPQAVIRPNSTEEVAAIVQCASSADIKVQARSGGHSYANFGLGDGAIAVDLVNFQQYSMDETTGYATVGAGMKLGDVDTNLEKTGRAFAHGVCPGVGIGGHATIVSSLLDEVTRDLMTFSCASWRMSRLQKTMRRVVLVQCRECGGLRLIILSRSKWLQPMGASSGRTKRNTPIYSL